jgi:shikimate kinase
MRDLMKERYPVYAEADITVVSRDVPHEVIVEEVIEALIAWLDNDTAKQHRAETSRNE